MNVRVYRAARSEKRLKEPHNLRDELPPLRSNEFGVTVSTQQNEKKKAELKTKSDRSRKILDATALNIVTSATNHCPLQFWLDE